MTTTIVARTSTVPAIVRRTERATVMADLLDCVAPILAPSGVWMEAEPTLCPEARGSTVWVRGPAIVAAFQRLRRWETPDDERRYRAGRGDARYGWVPGVGGHGGSR